VNGSFAHGSCRLATSLASIPASEIQTQAATLSDAFGLTAVTEFPVGPGPVDFGVECRQGAGNIDYHDIQVSAVAISPD
jgi:hypothetical protein